MFPVIHNGKSPWPFRLGVVTMSLSLMLQKIAQNTDKPNRSSGNTDNFNDKQTWYTKTVNTRLQRKVEELR